MTRFPDEVWEHILALRPRDRDASSPTAAALRDGIERDRTPVAEAPLLFGGAPCLRFTKICPMCGAGYDWSFWCPSDGLFYTWATACICLGREPM